MANINGSISLASKTTQSVSGVPGASPLTTSQTVRYNLPNPAGTVGTADQADVKYSKTLTLAATPTVLDLTALPDPFGNSISFARVRSMLIVNSSETDGQTLTLGYSSTTASAWTALVSNPGTLTVQPSSTANDGFLFLVAPNTSGMVVSSGSRLLKLDPGANTITVQVEILGCSV